MVTPQFAYSTTKHVLLDHNTVKTKTKQTTCEENIRRIAVWNELTHCVATHSKHEWCYFNVFARSRTVSGVFIGRARVVSDPTGVHDHELTWYPATGSSQAIPINSHF